MTDEPRPDYFWELALATNAAFKGLLASLGQSGHICKATVPFHATLDLSHGWFRFTEAIVGLLHDRVEDGDVAVISEKMVAASLGRIGPRHLLTDPDPKTIDPSLLQDLANQWARALGFRVEPLHLLLADEYDSDRCTVGVDDHNGRCAQLADRIRTARGVAVDVIISDTDTGLDTRAPLIGAITIAATPVGATRGINLYEAMRCATAAEFTRGHDRHIPVVLCKPADRRRARSGTGEHRGYSGALHIDRETGVAHA